jgi:hypothetical protein
MPRKINPLETNTMARAVVAGELKNLGYHVSISKNPMLTKSPSGIEFNLVVQASLYGAARAEPSPFSPLQG